MKTTSRKKKLIHYDKEKSRLDSSGLYYKDSDSELEMESDRDEESDEEKSPLVNVKRKKNKNPLITDLDYNSKEVKRAKKAQMWFERDVFKNVLDERDEDADLDRLADDYKRKGGSLLCEVKNVKLFDSDYHSDDSDLSDYDAENELKVVNQSKEAIKVSKVGKRKYKLNEEELVLGALLVSSKNTERDITYAGWNRYAFNDTNLPEWFVKDEEKHMKKEVPVPKVSREFVMGV